MKWLFFKDKNIEERLEVYDTSMINIVISFKDEYFKNENIVALAEKLLLDLDVVKIRILGKYHTKNFINQIQNATFNQKNTKINHFSLYTKYGENIVIGTPFHYKNPPYSINMSIRYETYLKMQYFIDLIIADFSNSFCSCFIINSNYSSFQNSLDIEPLIKANIDTKDFKIKKDLTGDRVIDVSKNPGREKVIENTWIMAGWRMYLGNNAFNIDHLYTFDKAFHKEILSNDILYIQLYEHWNEPHFKKNINAQKAFLEHIGYDKLIYLDRNLGKYKASEGIKKWSWKECFFCFF